MIWEFHRRYAYPLSWDLGITTREWGLPFLIKIRPKLTDGSGQREYVANIRIALFCLYWDICYAWGQHRYHWPEPTPVLSLKEVLERDQLDPLTKWVDEPDNNA